MKCSLAKQHYSSSGQDRRGFASLGRARALSSKIHAAQEARHRWAITLIRQRGKFLDYVSERRRDPGGLIFFDFCGRAERQRALYGRSCQASETTD